MDHQLLSQPFKPQGAKAEPRQIRKLDCHVHIWCWGGGRGKARSHLAQKALLIYKAFEVGEVPGTGGQRGAFSPHASPRHSSAAEAGPSPGVILGPQKLASPSFTQQALLS